MEHGTPPGAVSHERALHRAALLAALLLVGSACAAGAMLPAIPSAPETVGPQLWFLAALVSVFGATSCALALIVWVACDHLSHIDLQTRSVWRAVYTTRYALADHPDVVRMHQALNRELARRRPTRDWLSFAIAARRILDHPATRHRFQTRCAFFDANLSLMLWALDTLDQHALTAAASTSSWWWDDILLHAHAVTRSHAATGQSPQAASAALRARLDAARQCPERLPDDLQAATAVA